MKGKMKMISLDCSTKCSGMTMWENGKYKTSHVINCEQNKDVEERQKEMVMQLWKGLDYYCPSIVVIEDTYCHGNPSTQKKLDRIQGAIFAWCVTHNAEFNCIMPSSWRKYIDGFPNGKGTKRQEQKSFSVKYVTEKYNIKPKTDDESDSILIGEGFIKMCEERDGH